MVGRLFFAVVLGLVLAAPARADDVTLDWSVADRLTGRAGIDLAAPSRDAALRITVDGSCPAQPVFTVDGAPVAVTRAPACSFDLPPVAPKAHDVVMDAEGQQGHVRIDARDYVVASIGDSVASGEGNPDVSPRGWLERRCHRSLRSGAALAARAVELGDRHSVVTLVPLACSGATVGEGLLAPYDGVEPNRAKGALPPQVDQLRAIDRDVDALLISVGANDVNFGPFARFCVFVANCPDRRFDPTRPGREAPPGVPTAAEVERKALARLPGEYDALARALEGRVDPAKTIIVEYFDPLRDETGATCAAALPHVDRREAAWAEQNILVPLNAAIHAAAARHGWQVVGGVAEAFRRHGLCARPGSWITDPFSSGAAELALTGTLHPNGDGHVATATLIAPVLAGTLGVASGTEQIGRPRRGYVKWPWLLVVCGLGLAVGVAGGAVAATLLRRRTATR